MILKGLVVLSFIGMLVMNVLANTLPLGGRTTGDVSNQYPSLFTPVGFTFSIWGLIYLLLGVAVVYYVFDLYEMSTAHIQLFGVVFVLSSVFNVLWLVMWHHDRIVLSTVVMVVLFFVLMVGFLRIQPSTLWLRVPFSLYFAWISVALVANVTIMLVGLDMPRLGLSDALWMVLVMLVVGAIGLVTVYISKDVVFGLVFIWALYGILTRHVSELSMAYPLVVIVTGSVLFMIIVMSSWVFYRNGFDVFG